MRRKKVKIKKGRSPMPPPTQIHDVKTQYKRTRAKKDLAQRMQEEM